MPDERKMDSARWQRIESICFDATELPPEERNSFLNRACQGDAPLRSEVDALLAQIATDPNFLDQPIVNFASLDDEAVHAAEPLPASIGAYEVVRRLGRGGMGEVYLAIRRTEDIEQQVAIKVVRGGFQSDDAVRRFRLERRILASLKHENIAKLLDAATTNDGRPYFVMEFVDGLPVTDYCIEHKLSIAQQLELFQTICRAVQHAHQNLIVHRDIKPHNILVTRDGVPKLLDFGIGKILSPSDSQESATDTQTGLRILTPQYSAPEQISGASVTTATDVYLLGILLYEMLAGRHPYASGSESAQEIERAALETTPPRVSEHVDDESARRQLAGDLDMIVLKALRKEPERRYQSAAAFADDIQKHIDGLPVTARPDTLRYRTRKFVRRNAGLVAAVATAAVALTATTAVTLVQSARVRRESARVTAERDKAFEVRSFLMEMFGASGANRIVGDSVTARALLDLQTARVPIEYANQPALRAEMLEVLSDGYDRLGLFKDAEPMAREALELRRSILPKNHPDIATSLNAVGWITHELGRSAEAEPVLREAIAIRRAAGKESREDLSRSLNDLGVVLNGLRRPAEAESLLVEAVKIREEEMGAESRSVGIAASNLAAAYYFQSKLDSAIGMQERANRILLNSVGPDHQRSVVALANLAAFKGAKGDWSGAVSDYRELLVRQTRIQGAEHPVTVRVMASLAAALFNLGGEGRRTGADTLVAEAQTLYAQVIPLLEKAIGATHPQIATMLERHSGVLSASGDFKGALAQANRALAMQIASVGELHQNTAFVLSRISAIHLRAGDVKSALAFKRRELAALEGSVGKDNRSTIRARADVDSLAARVNRGS